MTSNFHGPVEDMLAIRHVLETYADAVNQYDADVWSSLWVEDSQWDLPDYPDLGTVHGKKAIVDLWLQAMPNYPNLSFTVSIGLIQVDGDEARARAYITEVYDDANSGKPKRACGEYNDQLVKRDGRWLLKHRTFRVRHQT
jgi:uncharacterized protein (TIGR02246 family)